jgi:hypothetical protein
VDEVDLTPVVLLEMKRLERLVGLGRDDMLLIGGDDRWLELMDQGVVRPLVGHPTRRCGCGLTHDVEAWIFGAAFVICAKAPPGHVALLDSRRFPRGV